METLTGRRLPAAAVGCAAPAALLLLMPAGRSTIAAVAPLLVAVLWLTRAPRRECEPESRYSDAWPLEGRVRSP